MKKYTVVNLEAEIYDDPHKIIQVFIIYNN